MTSRTTPISRSPADDARVSSPVLVGRDREFGLLLEAVTSPPAIVLVEGEAGIGKTRLAREVLDAVTDRRVSALVGRCHCLREPFPLGPVIEALGTAGPLLPPAPLLSPVTGVLRALLPEFADRLPPAFPPAGGVAERHRVFRALRDLLSQIGPAVLVLEDVHWADEATIDLLGFLLSDPPRDLSVVATYRSDEAAHRVAALTGRLPTGVMGMTMALRPLEPDDVGRLVSEILDVDRVSPAFAGYLHERSGGSPLAVEELVRALKDRRYIVRRGGAWARKAIEEIELPDALRGLVLERLARLSPNARLVTEAAAVLGEASDEVLLEVAGLPAGAGVEALSEALRAAVLEEHAPGTIAVRHSVAREVVEGAIPGPQRRQLHLRAGRALEASPSPPLARLARHYREAGQTSKLAAYAGDAADAALEAGEDAQAVRLLGDALSVPTLSKPTRIRLALKLAGAAVDGLAHDEAIPLLRGVLSEDPAPGVAGELRLALGRLLVQAGRGADAEAEFERAVDELGDRPGFAARALANLALPTTREPRGSHLRWAERAVALVSETDDSAARTGVMGDRAATLLYFGEPGAWDAVDDLPAPDGRPEQGRELVRVLHNLAEAAIYLGEYLRAEGFIARAVELAEQLRYERFTSHLDALAVALAWVRGDGSDEVPMRATAILESATSASPRTQMELILGLAALARGQTREAQRLLSSVADAGDAADWIPLSTAAGAGLAKLALMRADPGAALNLARSRVDDVRTKEAWVWGAEIVPVAVESLVALAEPDEAERLVMAFGAGIRGRSSPAARAALWACRGITAEARADLGAAERAYRRAELGWAALPRPYDAARARAARGHALLERGDDKGRALMISALETFERLAGSWDAARVRALLRRHGLAAPRHGGRPAYGRALSPREREVARLVAEGRKNREIAEALFLSPRTVEFHVANLMRKMEAPSRTALALSLSGHEGGASS